MRARLRQMFGRRSRLTSDEEKPTSGMARPQRNSVVTTPQATSIVTRLRPDCRALCATCLGCIERTQMWLIPASERLVDNHQGLIEPYLHHIHVSDLLDAVRQGCPICIILRNELMAQGLSENLSRLQEALPNLDGSRRIFLVCLVGKPGITEPGSGWLAGLSLETNHWSLTFDCFELSARVRLEMIPSMDLPDVVFGSPKSSHTFSEESWLQALGWIQECTSKHVSCNRVQDPGWCPTRLLDVGINSAASDEIRLVLSGDDSLVVPYTTLSHCWGKVKILTLIKENITQLQSGIAISSLPLTFREAIVVTRQLKIRYLWIDSLCIIQDDKDDWGLESLQMGKVYGNAFCNIAATASQDGTEGLFRERDPLPLQPIEFEASFESGIPKQRFNVSQHYYWETELLKAPLNRRAWAMQERLLARRVLHFTRRELVWDCREHAACESYPLGFPPGNPDKGRTWGFFATRILDDWASFVALYSQLQMTKPTDKLIAISGIVKQFPEYKNDRYIAGLWLKDMAHGMTWRNNQGSYWPPDKAPLHDHAYVAPTFSWASVDMATFPPFSSENSRITIGVNHSDVKSQNGDPTGIIESASIHLHGRMKRLYFRDGGTGVYTWTAYTYSSKGHDSHDARLTNNGILIDRPDMDFWKLNKRENLFLMPCHTRVDHRNVMVVDCLILELVDRGEAIYQRIGMLSQVGSEEADNTQDLMTKDPEEDKIQCLAYRPGAGDVRHSIIVV